MVKQTADAWEEVNLAQSVIVGFDGFVDEIIHLVRTRDDFENYARMDSMREFSERVAGAVGYSANIEMVPQQVKLGGNGPIMADALSKGGFLVTYIGALGRENVDPVFHEFAASCERVISLADPAHTEALEFNDGKLMMGKMDSLHNVKWENLLEMIDEDELSEWLEGISLVACVNWTMLPFMNGIFDGLTELFKGLSDRMKVFVDLADPRKRAKEDIRDVLELLVNMQKYADIILGLNENESVQVYEVLDGGKTADLSERADNIRRSLGLSMTVVHPIKSACVSHEGGTFFMEGPYTASPRLSTGAGDVFNAGFCKGVLLGGTPEQALASALCSSGYYVRNANAPRHEELIEFMRTWAAADCGAV